jgi:hypothetical protein
MSWRTDKRFQQARFRGAEEPQQISRARSNNDLAERRKIHAASEEKNQYAKKVSVQREPTFRE